MDKIERLFSVGIVRDMAMLENPWTDSNNAEDELAFNEIR
jgi:hypothetical protein